MPSLKSSIGNSKHISLDDVCFLISKTYTKDNLKQQIEVDEERQIFCSVIGTSRQEFFNSGENGMKQLKTIVVDSDEYDGETALLFNNIKYTIYRHFMRDDGFTELYCEVRKGV